MDVITAAELGLVVDRVRKGEGDGPRLPIAVRAIPRWEGEAATELNGELARVIACPSTLAVREALVEYGDGDERLVVLTDRAEGELGRDVLVRLARRQILRVDPLGSVGALFRATGVDPALRKNQTLVDALVRLAPAGGYASPVSGFLDLDTAWRAALDVGLGLRDTSAGLLSLLEWAEDFGGIPHDELGADLIEGLTRWLVQEIGPTARPMLAAIAAGKGRDAVAAGLVLSVLFSDSERGENERLLSRGRFEGLFGAVHLDEHGGKEWASAAESIIRTLASERRAEIGAHAESILDEVGASDFAGLSTTLPSSFELRLAEAGRELGEALDARSQSLSAVVHAQQSVGEHARAVEEPGRIRAIGLAVRLLRYLRVEVAPAAEDFADAASSYSTATSFVDFARAGIGRVEPVQELASSLNRIEAAVSERRERENERFGRLLANWLELGSSDSSVLEVERVLEQVVAPIAATTPVLLLIVDGMSFPVYRELAPDLIRDGWIELVREGGDRVPAISVLPSVTSYSRASLLSGDLTHGTGASERRGFTSSAPLRAASKAGNAPRLFEQAELTAAAKASLPEAVEAALLDPEIRVVGIVVNAVDDALSKGLQLDWRWSLETIPVLGACLGAARTAGRVVVLTADHGHVVERDVVYRSTVSRAERWHAGVDDVAEGEVVLRGPRVLAGDGAIVAPWTERLRYTTSRNAGYHGGATPQEVVVPLVVLVGGDVSVQGWSPVGPDTPEWWEEAIETQPVVQPTGEDALTLFGTDSPAVSVRAEWIDTLLSSSIYVQQLRLNSRVAPPNDLLVALLEALEGRGGSLTFAGLARSLNLPEVRVRSLVAATRRVLAVDGESPVDVDTTSETVTLNRPLLASQFRL